MEIPPASFCFTLRAFVAPLALSTVAASSGARARAVGEPVGLGVGTGYFWLGVDAPEPAA
jgi:hypothetical protein